MKCIYCDKTVIGSGNAVTVDLGAPAHARCYQFHLISQRIFKSIKLTTLTDNELNELQDLVKLELNSRADMADSVELF